MTEVFVSRAGAGLPERRAAVDLAADGQPRARPGQGPAGNGTIRGSEADICELSVVAGRAAFDALGPEWAALFARSGRPHQVFQTFEWLWHWANHYLDEGARLSIVTGRRQGRLVLVWPLVSTRMFGIEVLSFMGEPASQYGDALVEDAPDADALLARAWDCVTALPVDLVWLRRVRTDAVVAPILDRRARPAGAVVQAPFVDFDGARDVASFEKRFPAKLRSGRRRHLRRLAEAGPVAFEHHAPGAQARDLARLAFAFKRDWAKQKGRSAPTLFDPRLEDFFVAAAAGREHSPSLRLSVLRCAGEPIGVEISVACKDRLFGHVLAPKPGFEKQGAGTILAGHSIASAVEQGFRVYDLLAPADPYKLEWASDSVGVRDFAVARTFAGRLVKWSWLDFGRDAGRSLARRVPLRLGRPFAGRASESPAQD